jgi:hypothetical protein
MSDPLPAPASISTYDDPPTDIGAACRKEFEQSISGHRRNAITLLGREEPIGLCVHSSQPETPSHIPFLPCNT